ncbi:hypothetical protein CANINC_001732 [Pichia inconspicua]|uniref:triacylglycerol lipase n=1 Tax=Pichia inconspicua TaxID=52247 RepID=A0A4T0X371_9ASCO|nr:hypothetical protein CANINC_001732 [[Candida] inconspicua]
MLIQHQLVFKLFIFATLALSYTNNTDGPIYKANKVQLSILETKFSLYDKIVRSAIFSALSYCTKHDNIKSGNLQLACPCTLCTENEDNVTVVKVFRGKVSGVLFKDDSNAELILAIKGTTSNSEWLMDFKILPIPYHFMNNRKRSWKKFIAINKNCKGCTVHKGFYDGAREIYDNMFDDFYKLIEQNPEYKISVVGHSLGGAIAPFIANELLLAGKSPRLTTFGSPKIGNKVFAKWMNKLWNIQDHYTNIESLNVDPIYIRVSHKNDIVPLLPTRQMGYKHSGIDLFFTVSEIPMLEEHIKLKSSSSTELNPTPEPFPDFKSKKEFDAAMDSHRVYILRMNQCVAKQFERF